jgi:hypothetical protein
MAIYKYEVRLDPEVEVWELARIVGHYKDGGRVKDIELARDKVRIKQFPSRHIRRLPS